MIQQIADLLGKKTPHLFSSAQTPRSAQPTVAEIKHQNHLIIGNCQGPPIQILGGAWERSTTAVVKFLCQL